MKDNKIKYITSKRALDILGISIVTLRSWASKGIIDTIRTAGNHRLYNVDKYLNKIENKHSNDDDDNNSIGKADIKFNEDTNSEHENHSDHNSDSQSDSDNDDVKIKFNNNDDEEHDHNNNDDEEQEYHNNHNHSDSESDDNNNNDSIKFNNDSEDDEENKKSDEENQDEDVNTKKIDYRNMGRMQPICNKNKNKTKTKTKTKTKKNEKNDNYDSDDESNIKKTKYNKKKYNVCYIRVSNLSEVPLLNQQESYVKKIYPNYKIITDIGSGLDFNKEGFLRLFSMILNKKINKLVLLNKGSVLPPAYNFIKKLIVEFNDGQLIIDKNKKFSVQNNFQSDLKHLIQYYN